MIIITKCLWCGEKHEFEVPFEDYFAFLNGEPIQVAMPQLSADERERLISGICPNCYSKAFSDEYEDETDLEMGFNPYEGCYSFDC